MSAESSLVLREDIEKLWASVQESTADPRAGIFGPESISWKINRESALFLGAGRASLLQLAHPWVAAALDQHSNLRNDPLARFHHTFRVVFTMIFGTLDQALAASRRLYQLHTRIRGELPEAVAAHARGSHYEANEVHALVWVYATLIESALMAYECALPPLPAGERETYYAESRLIAALFGIAGDKLPADWRAFEAYSGEMLRSGQLGVNALSSELAERVLHGRGSWVPVPGWYRALTAAWLPDPLRNAFGLAYGEREQRSARVAAKWVPRLYCRLPAAIRYVGPYREALARIQGVEPGPLVGLSNRFWMGQARTMFGGAQR
jgi:uncharacterized protein (DUF2236 family)